VNITEHPSIFWVTEIFKNNRGIGGEKGRSISVEEGGRVLDERVRALPSRSA